MDSTRPCHLHNLPLEPLEIIIGNLDIRDLPKFLGLSKQIHAAFYSTRYSSQLAAIVKYELKALSRLLLELRKQKRSATWRVHDTLECLTSQTCTQCGGFGWIVFWLSTPPQKLCSQCNMISLTVTLDELANYGLTMADMVHVPILQTAWRTFTPQELLTLDLSQKSLKRLTVSSEMFCDIWREKQKTISQRDDDEEQDDIDDEYKYDPENEYDERDDEEHDEEHDDDYVGFNTYYDLDLRPCECPECRSELLSNESPIQGRKDMRPNGKSAGGAISMDFIDYRTSTGYNVILCNFCKFLELPTIVPHTHEHLRQHFAQDHPKALAAFEAGWHALPTILREKWIARGIKDCIPGYPASLENLEFISWPEYMLRCLRCQVRDQVRRTSKGKALLFDTVSERMEHSGSLFGQPALPDRIAEEPPNDQEKFKRCTVNVAIDRYLADVQVKALAQMKAEIEKNGLEALTAYLNWDDPEELE